MREIENDVLEPSNAKDIANALHGLFKVSRGDADHIIITGGSECAFIAALAYWLLNLKVLVRNSAGQVIYDSVRNGATGQVVIHYGEVKHGSLQITGTAYILGHCREVFDRIPERDEYYLKVRPPWSCCLSRVFGTTFSALSKMPHVLGDHLGGVARIYRAVATGENNIGNLSRMYHVNYAETSYALGFISTLFSTFPELSNVDGLHNRMQHAINISFDEAVRNVEQSILSLEAICTCEYCASEPDPLIIMNDNSRMCLVGVAYAIRRIAMVMSYVVQDPENANLLPTVAGIYEFSALGKQPTSAFTKASVTSDDLDEGRASVYGNRTWKRAGFYWNAIGLRHEQRLRFVFEFHPLESVFLLFQGSRWDPNGMVMSNPHPTTAISSHGICYYMEALKELNCQAERLCRVHILPRQIHCKNRRYDSVQDDDVVRSEIGTVADLPDASLQEPSTSIPNIKQDPEITKVEALASERASGTAITFVYRVILINTSIYISPGRLTQSLLESSGLVACEGRGCSGRLAIPCHHVSTGWRVFGKSSMLNIKLGLLAVFGLIKTRSHDA